MMRPLLNRCGDHHDSGWMCGILIAHEVADFRPELESLREQANEPSLRCSQSYR